MGLLLGNPTSGCPPARGKCGGAAAEQARWPRHLLLPLVSPSPLRRSPRRVTPAGAHHEQGVPKAPDLFPKITRDAVTGAKHPPSQRLPASPPALRERVREGRVSSLWDRRRFSAVQPLPPGGCLKCGKASAAAKGKQQDNQSPRLNQQLEQPRNTIKPNQSTPELQSRCTRAHPSPSSSPSLLSRSPRLRSSPAVCFIRICKERSDKTSPKKLYQFCKVPVHPPLADLFPY